MDNMLIINSRKNKDFKQNKEKMLEFKVKSLTQLIREYSDEQAGQYVKDDAYV